MTKLTAIVAMLAAFNFCTAISVIYFKHLSRVMYNEISERQSAIDRLDVEWSKLQIEESTFSEHGLVERVASERLEMVYPVLSETVMIVR